MGGLLSIAQAAASGRDLLPVLMTLSALIAVVVAGGVVLLMLRKRMFSDRAAGEGSIFEDLRRMRKEGTISEVEYEYLRRCMAARAAGREPPPRPAELEADVEELVAPPGYDLTGAPIPAEVLEARRRRGERPE